MHFTDTFLIFVSRFLPMGRVVKWRVKRLVIKYIYAPCGSWRIREQALETLDLYSSLIVREEVMRQVEELRLKTESAFDWWIKNNKLDELIKMAYDPADIHYLEDRMGHKITPATS